MMLLLLVRISGIVSNHIDVNSPVLLMAEISMYETLLRPHEVHTVPALQPIDAVADKLKRAEAWREAKRLKQVAASSALREKKRKRANDDENSNSTRDKDDAPTDPDSSHQASKRTRTNGEEQVGEPKHAIGERGLEGESLAPAVNETRVDLAVGGDGTSLIHSTKDAIMYDASCEQGSDSSPAQIVIREPLSPPPVSQRVVSKVMQEVRGHTSYLTFAVLLPTILPPSDILVQDVPFANTPPPDKPRTG